MIDKLEALGQGIQFILLLGLVFRSLTNGQLDQTFFILLGVYFILSGMMRLRAFFQEKNQMDLFLGLSQGLAGILFFFIQ